MAVAVTPAALLLVFALGFGVGRVHALLTSRSASPVPPTNTN